SGYSETSRARTSPTAPLSTLTSLLSPTSARSSAGMRMVTAMVTTSFRDRVRYGRMVHHTTPRVLPCNPLGFVIFYAGSGRERAPAGAQDRWCRRRIRSREVQHRAGGVL